MLPGNQRPGCVTFEDRIFWLIENGQKDSHEFKTWTLFFGVQKIEALESKYQEIRAERGKIFDMKELHPDEEGWVMLMPEQLTLVTPDEVECLGSELPGGARYAKIRANKTLTGP